jgi:hypothetical protein
VLDVAPQFIFQILHVPLTNVFIGSRMNFVPWDD